MILAGIDEAGYGPLLGPLVVGLAAVRGDGPADVLESVLAEALADRSHGVPVEDSKTLHSSARGPRRLEAAVLALLAARDGSVPSDAAGVLAALGASGPAGEHRWYGTALEGPFPLAASADEALQRGLLLRAAMERRGVRLAALRVRILREGDYNDAVGRAGSKAAVNFDLAADCIEAARLLAGGTGLTLHCDRQGARGRYGPLLQRRFAESLVRVLEEAPGRSAYALGGERPGCTVRFEEKADGLHAVTAMAAMVAKYVRELHMDRLNRFVLDHAPGVRATAGYWTDGLRFLKETGEARRRLGIEDSRFVRVR